MDHELELISPILEILEIEVFNILYKPGNIGNLSFSTSSYPGNIGKRIFSTSSYPGNIGSYDPYSVLSWKYWIVRSIFAPMLMSRGSRGVAGARGGSRGVAGRAPGAGNQFRLPP